MLDGGEILEFGARFAKNPVVGLRCIDAPVGAAASDKGAFVNMYDRYGIPKVVLPDTPGFRPGVRKGREAVLRPAPLPFARSCVARDRRPGRPCDLRCCSVAGQRLARAIMRALPFGSCSRGVGGSR